MADIDLIEEAARLARSIRRRPGHWGGFKGAHGGHGGHHILGIILEEDGIRTSELAEKLDIRPSSVSEAVSKLEEAGFAARKKDENDSRSVRIYATEKAKDSYSSHNEAHKSLNSKLLARLDDGEAEAFAKTCAKIRDFFESEFSQEGAQNDGAQHGHWHGGHDCHGKGLHHGHSALKNHEWLDAHLSHHMHKHDEPGSINPSQDLN
jgi:DNA-binding MarR family transcriptional regulator